MCKYSTLTFIFYLLIVFVKSASDISNSTSKINNGNTSTDNNSVTKIISNFDQTTFKRFISKERNLLKKNEFQKENATVESKTIINTSTKKNQSQYDFRISELGMEKSFNKSQTNDSYINMKIKLNINPAANVPIKQHPKAVLTKDEANVFLGKLFTDCDINTVDPNVDLISNQTVLLIVPKEYNMSALLEIKIIEIFTSLNSVSTNTSANVDTTKIKKIAIMFNDAEVKSATSSTFSLKDDNKSVPEINGVTQIEPQGETKGNSGYGIKDEKQNEKFENYLSKTAPPNITQKHLLITSTTTEKSKPSPSNNTLKGFTLKKRNILSYERDDEKNLINALHRQNKENFLNDIKPEQININEPENHHVYKRVKKDLSRLFLHQQNDKDKIDFSFPKLTVPLFLLPPFKSEDFANKKSINTNKKTNKRSNMHEKSNSVPFMAVQTSLMDYFLNNFLFESFLTELKQDKEIDAHLIVDTLISNIDESFFNNEVSVEPKYHRLTNNHNNKKHHKHKRHHFSKQHSSTVASSTMKDIAEDAESEAIKAIIKIFNDENLNDDNKKGTLKEKRSLTQETPTLIVSDNFPEIILIENSSERYKQPQNNKVCRIKRNELLSSTIPSVACLMLSLGFLCYFLHKRKCLNKSRRCIWFVVPARTEIITERALETNTTDDDDVQMIYKNNNFQIA